MYNSWQDDLVMFLLIVLVVFGLVGGFIFLTLIRFNTDSNGEHSGYITAIEQQGIFYHNYQVYVKTDNQSSQEDIYCLPEGSELVNQLREYNKSRTQVVLHYTGIKGLGWNLCGYDQITFVEVAQSSGSVK